MSNIYMAYHAYPPYDTNSGNNKNFDFRKVFNNKQWHRVPYHAKNMIVNLGHLINNSYFNSAYKTNKNEPRRLADIYKEQNNYFDYVISYLNKYKKYEKDPGTKKAYGKLISMVSIKKDKVTKPKDIKKVKEAFMNIIPTEKKSRFLLVLTIIIAFFYFVSK